MLKTYSLLIAISYSLVLVILSLINIDIGSLAKFAPSFSDKVYHFIAYSIFTWLWFNTFFYKLNQKKNNTLLRVVILAIVFGIVIEILQREITSTRVFELNDIIANVLGVLFTIFILVISIKTEVKKE
ncbi:MAG: VanZ family protein [Bacteroidetes bacterium]|nr:VanZ family protein [Bacteroidota bacterium]